MLMLKKLLPTMILCCIWSSALFAQPANDNCMDAMELAGLSESVEFSTLEATTDGPEHPTACSPSAGSTPGVIYNDIWYAWTAEISQEIEFTTCNRADFDTKLAVYGPNVACPVTDADIIACNEDGPGCANFESVVIFEAEAGQTYLLRVGGWGDGEPGSSGSGTFALIPYQAPDAPPNDNCFTAIELILDEADSTSVEFVSIGADTGGPEHPPQSCFDAGEPFVYNDIWYTWTSTFTGFLEWSNCGTSNFDSRMAVYTAGPDECNIAIDSLIGCSDDGLDENDFNCPGFTSRAIFPVIEGEVYKFRLGGWSASDAGEGSFTVKRFFPPPAPSNDLCADAAEAFIITPLEADNFDVVFEGTNRGATGEGPNPYCRLSGEFQDVWYRFNSGFNTEIAIFFSPNLESTSFVVDLFSACGEQVPQEVIDFCLRIDEPTVEFIGGFPGEPTEWLLRVTTRITTDRPGDFFFQLVGEPFSTDIQELALSNFQFFPNPVAETALLNFDLPAAANTDIVIFNTMGQAVQRQALGVLSAGKQNLALDLAALPTGVYILNIQQASGVKSLRFVKE